MIDPVIYTFNIFGYQFPLYWYGVIVMLGAVAGTWLAEKEISRRGENGEVIWDALVWVLPVGLIGARLWFVVNATLGGNSLYLTKPLEILNIRAGGLHFFGGLLFGGIALLYYLNKNRMDIWLFLDSIAPAVLLGQAVARPANFINQELYGPPTNLIWGISIAADHRLPSYPASQFPVETTRFHPTFAYEMILNVAIVLFLLWLARRYQESFKAGTIFGVWLILAGLSRTVIELFRPDQPRIGDSIVTYTMLASLIMSIVGIVILLIRYGKLQAAFASDWQDGYTLSSQNKTGRKLKELSDIPLALVAAKSLTRKPSAVKSTSAKKIASKKKTTTVGAKTKPAKTKSKPAKAPARPARRK